MAFATLWIPAFAGMTGEEGWNGGEGWKSENGGGWERGRPRPQSGDEGRKSGNAVG